MPTKEKKGKARKRAAPKHTAKQDSTLVGLSFDKNGLLEIVTRRGDVAKNDAA